MTRNTFSKIYNYVISYPKWSFACLTDQQKLERVSTIFTYDFQPQLTKKCTTCRYILIMVSLMVPSNRSTCTCILIPIFLKNIGYLDNASDFYRAEQSQSCISIGASLFDKCRSSAYNLMFEQAYMYGNVSVCYFIVIPITKMIM